MLNLFQNHLNRALLITQLDPGLVQVLIIEKGSNLGQASLPTLEVVRLSQLRHRAVMNTDIDFDLTRLVFDSNVMLSFIEQLELPQPQLLKHVELLDNQMRIPAIPFDLSPAVKFSSWILLLNDLDVGLCISLLPVAH